MPARQNASGFTAGMVEIDGDDRVDRLALDRVILAHADPATAAVVDDAIGEPPVTRGRRERHRLRLGCALRLAIEAAVGEMGEVDGSVRHQP